MSDDDRRGGDAPDATPGPVAVHEGLADPSGDAIAAGWGAAALQPRWLRPGIVALVAGAHAATLIALTYVHPSLPPAVETIEATVIAAGDEAPVTTAAAPAPQSGGAAAPEAKPDKAVEQAEADAPPTPAPPPEARPAEGPATPSAQETPPPPPVETPPPKTAEKAPPQPAAPENPPPLGAADEPLPPPAPALARLEEPPPPPPPPRDAPQRPKAQPKAAAERPKPPKPAAAKASVAKAAAAKSDAASNTPGSSEAHHVGTAAGQPVNGATRASYAALVVAEIQSNRYYPSSARERGEEGAVGVTFTIGRSGRVASASVVRPSGFSALDAAARQIVRSIAPPPPPGGSFSASTTIRFHVE